MLWSPSCLIKWLKLRLARVWRWTCVSTQGFQIIQDWFAYQRCPRANSTNMYTSLDMEQVVWFHYFQDPNVPLLSNACVVHELIQEFALATQAAHCTSHQRAEHPIGAPWESLKSQQTSLQAQQPLKQQRPGGCAWELIARRQGPDATPPRRSAYSCCCSRETNARAWRWVLKGAWDAPSLWMTVEALWPDTPRK